jgi:hypothetical protein
MIIAGNAYPKRKYGNKVISFTDTETFVSGVIIIHPASKDENETTSLTIKIPEGVEVNIIRS